MKITLYKVIKGFRYLRHYGMKKFLVRVGERLEPDEVPYGPWYEKHRITKEEWERQRTDSDSWENRPLVSVCVPLYRTQETFLTQMIESVQKQSYANWQLCLADGTPDDSVKQLVKKYCREDARICYRHLEENLGIAENTNAAFAMAEGVWIGLLDHDDILAPDAFYEVLAAAGVNPASASKVYDYDDTYWKKHKKADVVYTDEDKVSEDLSEHIQAHWKPDFNLDLLRSNNYITHFFAVKKSIVEQVGGFRREYDGAQDYDFIFRCTGVAEQVAHVPRILYHWRVSQASTADNPASKQYAFEAGLRAIEEHLRSCGVQAEVMHRKDWGFYRVRYPVQGEPLISILIPNKDQTETLNTCIRSILKSSYCHYEIILVENNSSSPKTFAYYEKLTGQPYDADQILTGKLKNGAAVSVVTWKGEFNYSAINNYGAAYAQGEFLVLLNNDIELITADWLEEMLGNCQRREVGAVGARLLYGDGTVQHAGIVVGIGGIASNMFVGLKGERDGYLHKSVIQMDYSAVTAACMMIKRSVFDEVGGFTETLTVAFNDVDLCLKMGEAGYLIVYNPDVRAYHYESKSRGTENTMEKVRRFEGEMAYIREHWNDILTYGDPFYNRNLTLNKSNYSLKHYR